MHYIYCTEKSDQLFIWTQMICACIDHVQTLHGPLHNLNHSAGVLLSIALLKLSVCLDLSKHSCLWL